MSTSGRQQPIEIRAPAPLHTAIDEYAAVTGTCRSVAVRELILRSLELAGMWPPTAAKRAGSAG
jgi:hypothetical protein